MHEGITRVVATDNVAKDGLSSLVALCPTAPNQPAVAARGIYQHGAKNRTENTDEIEVLFLRAPTARLLLYILFLMAVPITESRLFGHRLAQRLIGKGDLPAISVFGRQLLVLGRGADCEKIRQPGNHIVQILHRS